MITASSQYLLRLKPVLRSLQAALREHFPYASILAQDTAYKMYHVAASGTVISEDSVFSARGFVARVHNGRGFCEYAFSGIQEKDIPEIVRTVLCLAEGAGGDDKLPEETQARFCKGTEYEIDPEELGDEKIVAELMAIREAGLACDPRVLDMAARFNYQKIHKLFLSDQRDMEQNILWANGALSALASRGEELKDYYIGFSTLGGAELLPKMRGEVKRATDVVIELLDSQPIPPGEYDCVCDPDTTGMIVHEAFGHGVEMDMFVKDRAQAREFIGKRVASDLVNMHDGALAADECATFFFDDEGTPGGDTLVIKNGILQKGYCDAVSASRLNVEPTGNGRRQGFDRKAYTRMTNTYFEAGTDTPEDMIASIQYGFLLENPSSGMEDPKNWGIQMMVNIAREIKDGKLTGRVFSPIVMTGYVPDLLKSISMMSSEVTLAGGGYCGKGYKEWVKVSDGGPYIKARIRLG